MMLILDFELKENSNESPLLSLHDADLLLTWRLAKEFCYLPAKYKNSRACGEEWWTTATASWGHPQSPWYHDLICVCGRVFVAVRTFCSGAWQESHRSSQSRGVMLTEGGCKLFFLLVRCFGKFKWHLWYRLVKLQWESICRSAGTSLTISGFLWNVLIAANFFFFYSL